MFGEITSFDHKYSDASSAAGIGVLYRFPSNVGAATAVRFVGHTSLNQVSDVTSFRGHVLVGDAFPAAENIRWYGGGGFDTYALERRRGDIRESGVSVVGGLQYTLGPTVQLVGEVSYTHKDAYGGLGLNIDFR